MTDGQSLYLVLAVLYLSECVVWVDAGSVTFKVYSASRALAFLSRGKFSNGRGGLDLLNPLLPWGLNFAGHGTPVALSPAGICSGSSAPAGGGGAPPVRAVPYESIGEVAAEGKYLLVDGRRFRKCASPRQASSLSALVDRLRALRREERAGALRDELSRRLSLREAEGRLRETVRAAAPLRVCCLLSFLHMFAVLPALVHGYSLHRMFVPSLAAILCLSLATAALQSRARAALHPGEGKGWAHALLKYVACPPVALRATDHAVWDAMERCHPVVLGKLFLGPAGLDFGRGILRELRHPCGEDPGDPLATEILEWHRREEFGHVRKFVEENYGVDGGNLLPAPPWDGESARYCPRCTAQFRAPATECADCPGVGLVGFDGSALPEAGDGR